MTEAEQILNGNTSLGIELGSTRIKAVLVGENFAPLASGAFDWDNRLENGIWTYSLDDIKEGLRSCYTELVANVAELYGVTLKKTASIGVSAMMHGYLAFDKNNNLLVPFRTWRNTMTAQAAKRLTEEFNFNIPQRWSVAHLYQAILNKERHVSELDFLTTPAGYVHWLLTGERVIGIGDASGMFPIDSKSGVYSAAMLEKFAMLIVDHGFGWQLEDIMPKIIPVGECAGRLTEAGARLLDPTGGLSAGVPFCPPEGDAQTGMVATNSIAGKTCNVSAGTSIFAMAVLERDLTSVHEEIDIVTTPCGRPVAMVHCNNCTGDLDAWIRLIDGALKRLGVNVAKPALYDALYDAALSGKPDCGGILSCNYYSGEHVTDFTRGMPLLMRTPEADFSIENFMRCLVYSSMATLKLGMDILIKKEKMKLDKITAHGGLFKSPVTGQRFLSAALGVPVSLLQSAGEGGAWGIALLAAYSVRENRCERLEDYLDTRVFKGMCGSTVSPISEDVEGFAAYTEKYRAALEVEKTAVSLNIG